MESGRVNLEQYSKKINPEINPVVPRSIKERMKIMVKKVYTWFVNNISKKMDFIWFLMSVKIFILIPVFVHYQHILLKDFIKRNGGIRKESMGMDPSMRRY